MTTEELVAIMEPKTRVPATRSDMVRAVSALRYKYKMTVKDIATAACLHPSTIYRYLKDANTTTAGKG